MALCQENMPPSMLNGGGGRPSPTFYTAYGHNFVPPGGQVNGGNGHMGQYVPEQGQYHQYHVPPMGYDTTSPSQPPSAQQQRQPGEEENPMSASHGQPWHYSGSHIHHARPAHAGLDDWSQTYLPVHPPNNGGTPPLHQQSHYGSYSYRASNSMESYDPHSHGVETSPSTDSSSPPEGPGSGPGGGSSTKQLRPPFEWMKPANIQPVPGKTRTKDKYRVVYSDHQRLELEKEFHFSRYITIRRKAEIAQQLQLSERQVKIWFQNRRAKERKQNKKREENLRSNSGVPKLEPLDSPPPITAQHHTHGHALSPNMGLNVNQHHMLTQSGNPANVGLSLPVSSHSHHLSSSLSQQLYPTHRLSPASSQGIIQDNHTLPPTANVSMSESVSVVCPVVPHPHPSQSLVTSSSDQKREPA